MYNIAMRKIIFTFFVLLAYSNYLISAETVPEFIKSEGYPVEEHYAVTTTGYILGLHRIPHGKAKPTPLRNRSQPIVLLQHGFAESSACWVLSGKNSALGFKLADKGYDVWLANARGTPYSFNHTTLNLEKLNDLEEFTSYSFYEQGIEDLPATIDYILSVTKRNNITLYAHSEGAAMYFAMGSREPDYLGKINAFFAFAPLVFIGNSTSPIINFLASSEHLYLGGPMYAILRPVANVILQVVKMLAGNFLTKSFSTTPMVVISGSASGQIDGKTISRLYEHFPTFVAKKQLLHLLQNVISNAFNEYNYGILNLIQWIKSGPDNINLHENLVPTYLYFSNEDLFINPSNIKQYNEAFTRKPKIYFVHNGFGHYDFVYGIDAHKVYNLTYKMLDKHSKQTK